ncbi:MAG: ATP-grasp domain-containing protein [Bacteroidales bacterium]|nr:ATP-grasp domain-containing protein [Bacteroidales bacterium]
MKKVIILGNDHTNTLGLTQTLGREGFEVIACVWGEKRGLVKSSKYCKELLPCTSPQDCVKRILKLPQEKNKIPIIASCDDAALILEKNKEVLADRFLFEFTQGDYHIESLLEKKMQVKLATEAGFNVPRSWLITDMMVIPKDIKYPCLIKPLVSSKGAKSDIRICRNEAEVKENLASLKYTKKVIIQKYIERDYEISILGCGLRNGDVVIPCVENKLTLYPKYTGLECLADMQPLKDEVIIKSIQNLIKVIGYVGLFSVEMMHCKMDSKFYFTEINLRNDGANSFVYKYGVNLPLIHICDLKGCLTQDSLNMTVTKPGYYIWDYHHFMSMLHRDISFSAWIREIIKSHGFLTYFPEDSKPFYKQYKNWILRKLYLRKIKFY